MSPSHTRARLSTLVLAGTLSLSVAATAPTTAAAQDAAAPQATTAASPVSASVRDAHIRYGAGVVVTGRVADRAAGTALVLEHRPRGGQWTPVARATTRDGGRYRLSARLRAGGRLRVVTTSGAPTATASGTTTAAPSSREITVRVAAVLRRARVRRHLVAGRSTVVRGRVAPARTGRVVRLQVRLRGQWRTVDRDRTSRRGTYVLRWRPSGTGRHAVRVRVGADAATTGTRRSLGRVNVYRSSHASWYGPGFYGGRTACGQTLGYGTLGVAHKSLPCGTKVTFRYRGRSVTVPVIDRGPFIAGREWDLTGATKRALGFGSTGNVLSTS